MENTILSLQNGRLLLAHSAVLQNFTDLAGRNRGGLYTSRRSLWYNKSKTSACACFGHGSWLPPIAAAQSMQPENEFPVA